MRPLRTLMIATVCSLALSPSLGHSQSLVRVAMLTAHHAPMRIAAFGSSSTSGTGASSSAASYPSRLQADLSKLLPGEPVQVLNDGIAGADADDFDKRLDLVLAQHPDLVILQTGTNDPIRGVPLERFEGETRADITRIRAAGVDVMLMEPQICRVLDATPGSAAYREAVRRIGAELHVAVIRRAELMQQWRDQHLVSDADLFAPDGLHMTDGGYALLGQEVAKEILASRQ